MNDTRSLIAELTACAEAQVAIAGSVVRATFGGASPLHVLERPCSRYAICLDVFRACASVSGRVPTYCRRFARAFLGILEDAYREARSLAVIDIFLDGRSVAAFIERRLAAYFALLTDQAAAQAAFPSP